MEFTHHAQRRKQVIFDDPRQLLTTLAQSDKIDASNECIG